MELLPNPHLHLEALGQQFREQGWVQIRDVFAEEPARELSQCLQRDVPWGLAYYDNGPMFMKQQQLVQLSDELRRDLERGIYKQARADYQYVYSCYPILDAYLQGWNEVALLNEFLEGLNSEPVLDLARQLSGSAEIIKADAQATRYGPGHFLGQHTDQSPPHETWVTAYIYNLTPQWRPDWGGYLQLIDADGNITAGLRPRFNTLNLLSVPQSHLVSIVSPFAGAARYSITGWFRSR